MKNCIYAEFCQLGNTLLYADNFLYEFVNICCQCRVRYFTMQYVELEFD